MKYNIKEKDKTREIKKKKYFFFEIGYMAPCTSPMCSGGKVGWSTIVQTIFVRNEDNGFENVLLQMTVLITDWGGCKN